MLRLSRLTLVILVGGAVGIISLLQPVVAADEPANVIKYRKVLMNASAHHITNIFSVLKGDTSYSGHIAANAHAISDSAAMMIDVFPEGSGEGNTRALPSIWQDWPKFEAAAVCTSAVCSSMRMVSTMPWAVMGLTHQAAPSAGDTSPGYSRQ